MRGIAWIGHASTIAPFNRLFNLDDLTFCEQPVTGDAGLALMSADPAAQIELASVDA